MKKIFFSLVALLMFSGISFASDPITSPVKTTESSIEWLGKKITGKHNGVVNLKEGNLEFDGDKMVGGAFVIDMTTITCTDLQGGSAAKLEGHLKSDDFFGVENNPDANLSITRVVPVGTSGDYKVTADLTIKNITKEIKFYTNVDKTMNKATANITIDRTDFDVRYGSGTFFGDLGDKTIYDEFDLVINLVY